MGKLKAFILEADHTLRSGQSGVRLFVKTQRGKSLRFYDFSLEPYFFVKPRGDLDKTKAQAEKLSVYSQHGAIKPKRVEEAEKNWRGKKVRLLKILCFKANDVPVLREELRSVGELFEHDIPYTRRYLVDKRITPTGLAQIEANGLLIENISSIASEKNPSLRKMAVDIETYNPSGIPDALRDPCLMVGFAGDSADGVFSYSKKFSFDKVKAFKTEKEMLEAICGLLREQQTDLVCTYNGDVFDLPYMQARAKKLGADFRMGRDDSAVRSKRQGLRVVSRLGGRLHYDVFPVVSFLNFIGTIRVPRLTLEKVYEEILGGKKLDVKKLDIWKTWDEGTTKELDFLAEYCLNDAVACLRLANHFLHLQLELSKLVGLPLVEVSRATASQLVESLLLRRAFERNELVPNKPSSEEIRGREENPIQGAFVKTPPAGVYENIAVLDFKSLYPSIIISHNIDVTTVGCDCCSEKEAFVSPQGHKFCAKRKGIIPETLGFVLDERFKLKSEMKKLSKDSAEYKALDARQWGLKILANSFYGYLLYARSRWYSRKGGEATTAWARQYIHETIAKAENAGFRVLYADTDSLFLEYPKGGEEKINAFKKSVNDVLPERMELELEDFYPRGVFVAKKQESRGAKKKYALINKEGKIKIRGFELVRRDWSRIARHTQREVLEILLKEGSLGKAVELVRKTIADLKAGSVPLEDCVIYTQLRKKVGSYEIQSPEVAAVIHARKSGLKIPENSVVGYVITRDGRSISEKARVAEQAENYDADYYVNNQVLPAVLKLLGALGFDEESIKTKGSQTSLLGSW